MAIYHLEAKVISRGIGRSAVAVAAYMSCSAIYNDYDGIQHDYTKKQGLVYEQIFLPNNAPLEWKNRSILWNAVEEVEKTKDSRLAREFVVALPTEFEKQEWISLLTEYVQYNFVNDGMCADVCIHDTDGHNPHAHIMLTVRPLAENGKWQSKTEKEYLCTKNGEERGFTAKEFKAAQADGWEKQYQYIVDKKKVYMPPSIAEAQSYERASKYPKSKRYGRQNPIAERWNSDEQLIIWRKNWADINNRYLEKHNSQERIDHRSFAERGIDEQPTIHEGVAARIMEQKGFWSERCEINRQIKADNKLLCELKDQVRKLVETVKKSVPAIASALENIRSRLIVIQYQLKYNAKQIVRAEVESSIISPVLNKYKDVQLQIKNKTKERKDLQSKKKSISPIHILQHTQLSRQITTLTEDIEELQSRKKMLLDEMYCKEESQVSGIEQRLIDNIAISKTLKSQKETLIQEKESGKAEYMDISANIPQNEIESVQVERSKIRDTYINNVRERIKQAYGDKYDYAMLESSEKEINSELGKDSVHIKLIHKQLQQHRNQKTFEKTHNRNEIER